MTIHFFKLFGLGFAFEVSKVCHNLNYTISRPVIHGKIYLLICHVNFNLPLGFYA